MAAALDARWKAAAYKTSTFPGLAADALARSEAHRAYDAGALADWILSARSYPPACNPFGPQGPPAFTVWANDRFVVNIYAYNTPEVLIHDHNFPGAFVNAAGQTVHCTFRFDVAERIDPNLRVGALQVAGIERIDVGDVRRIEPGPGFIHQVWHLSIPTVVVVVRTRALPRRAVRQFEYLRPAVAVEILRDDVNDFPAQKFRYTRKMLQTLRASGSCVDDLTRVIQTERSWAAVWHLIENWPFLAASGALEDVIARGAERHGQWFTAMKTVAPRVAVFHLMDWQRVVLESDRIVLALLMTMDSWPSIARTLQTLVPGASPDGLVIDSLRRLGEQRISPLVLAEGQLGILHCALRSHGQPREFTRLVRRTFDIDTTEQLRWARQAERELHQHELLRPLLN